MSVCASEGETGDGTREQLTSGTRSVALTTRRDGNTVCKLFTGELCGYEKESRVAPRSRRPHKAHVTRSPKHYRQRNNNYLLTLLHAFNGNVPYQSYHNFVQTYWNKQWMNVT